MKEKFWFQKLQLRARITSTYSCILQTPTY